MNVTTNSSDLLESENTRKKKGMNKRNNKKTYTQFQNIKLFYIKNMISA